MSLSDLEQRKPVRVVWLTEGITKEDPVDLLIHKQSQFTEVLANLAKRLSLPDEILDQIRFYEAHGNKIYKLLPPSHNILALNELMTIYGERIPAEEAEMDKEKGDRLVYCFHFEKDPTRSHGVPFVFMVKEGEAFKETKERISKRTGIKGKQFEKIRFAVVKGNYSRPVWVEDGTFISSRALYAKRVC
jgi:ubiquitin carboxyl-terminal hydrolase 7